MSVQENIQIVKNAYTAFGRGDIQGLLALLAEDIEWISPGGEVPPAGAYRGPDGVADFFQKLSETVEFSSFEPREFVAEGDRVLVVGFDSWRAKATNRTFEGHWVMAFTVLNGKVTNVGSMSTRGEWRGPSMCPPAPVLKGTPKSRMRSL